MNANIYGEVQFFTFVCGTECLDRTKRVKLGSIQCEYSDRLEKADQFVAANRHVKQIDARFVFSEFLDLAQ